MARPRHTVATCLVMTAMALAVAVMIALAVPVARAAKRRAQRASSPPSC